MLSPDSIKTKEVITSIGKVWVDEENILRLKITTCSQIERQDVEDVFEAYKKFGVGPQNKVLQLMDGRETYFSFSPEAKDRAAELGPSYFIASALVNDSFAIRLMFNFFVSIYKPKVPFKIFKSEEEAVKWLKTFV